jgi:UDP-N-acetylmuramate dehydrogenase
LEWAAQHGHLINIISGGSNIVVADKGVAGLVIQIDNQGHEINADGAVIASAGEKWDSLVQQTIAANLSGFECMSGVPGSVGATPIQNVGAYGQQVSDTLQWVRVWDRQTRAIVKMSATDCEFAYRWSRFKHEMQRFVVLQVGYQLTPGGAPEIKYKELVQELAGAAITSAKVRDAVLRLRRNKSMVVDSADPHSQSVGSFFLNPILSSEQAHILIEHSLKHKWVDDPSRVPVQHTHDGRIKIPAAWLIERAGVQRGYRTGAVGVSPNHALALVHYGAGTTAELLELARFVRHRVLHASGITLAMEPVLLGDLQAP